MTKFVSTGSALVTGLLKASAVKYVGWGIGTTGAVVTDTGLETASAEARTSGTQDDVQTDHADDTYSVVGAITCATAGKAITEVVIMSDPTAGSCYLRSTFAAINVDVGDSVSFTCLCKHDHSA